MERIPIEEYVHPGSAHSPEEWTDEFVNGIDGLLAGDAAKAGALLGLMQFVPSGARYPDEVTHRLAEHVRSHGFLSFSSPEAPDPEDDDRTLVTLLFLRAKAIQQYASSVGREEELLVASEVAETLVTALDEVALLLASRRPDTAEIRDVVRRAYEAVDDLGNLRDDSRGEWSLPDGSLEAVRTGLRGARLDPTTAVEEIAVARSNAEEIHRLLQASYASACIDLMQDAYNCACFEFRIGEFGKVGHRFTEILGVAERCSERTAHLPAAGTGPTVAALDRVRDAADEMVDLVRGQEIGDLAAVRDRSGAFLSIQAALDSVRG